VRDAAVSQKPCIRKSLSEKPERILLKYQQFYVDFYNTRTVQTKKPNRFLKHISIDQWNCSEALHSGSDSGVLTFSRSGVGAIFALGSPERSRSWTILFCPRAFYIFFAYWNLKISPIRRSMWFRKNSRKCCCYKCWKTHFSGAWKQLLCLRIEKPHSLNYTVFPRACWTHTV